MTNLQRADLKNQLDRASGNASALEQLYRKALAADAIATFREVLAQRLAAHPDDILLSAWACRLDLPLANPSAARNNKTTRYWRTAIVASAALGLLFVLLADGKPPIPLPGPAATSFWIGWAPLTAFGILVYLASFDHLRKNIRPYAIPATALLLITGGAISAGIDRKDDVAILIALHLPFLAWITVGAALAWRYPPPIKQGYAFTAKSLETALTGAIYAAAGILFLALTHGIFAILGVEFSNLTHLRIAACGVGSVPILALASSYDPTVAPDEQGWTTGLGHLLAILSKVLLALSLAVLIAYIGFFVPTNFWHPFRAREALIVYNTTIIAILVLLAAIATAANKSQEPILRYGVIALVALTSLLNAYSLAAIASRINQFGLSPNRYAAVGWNIVTLIVLTMILARQWRCPSKQWLPVLRQSIAYALVPTAAWALWMCLGLPLSFPSTP